MRILIVDDSLSARFFLKSCIPENSDYEIFEAADGKAGVEKYRKVKPEITFLDITMPVMNGFDALKEIIRIDPEASIVILSSDVQKKTTERIMDLGALLFLKKPPQPEQILAAINQVKENRTDRNQDAQK